MQHNDSFNYYYKKQNKTNEHAQTGNDTLDIYNAFKVDIISYTTVREVA